MQGGSFERIMQIYAWLTLLEIADASHLYSSKESWSSTRNSGTFVNYCFCIKTKNTCFYRSSLSRREKKNKDKQQTQTFNRIFSSAKSPMQAAASIFWILSSCLLRRMLIILCVFPAPSTLSRSDPWTRHQPATAPRQHNRRTHIVWAVLGLLMTALDGAHGLFVVRLYGRGFGHGGSRSYGRCALASCTASRPTSCHAPNSTEIQEKYSDECRSSGAGTVLPGKALTFLPEMTWPAQMMIMPLQQFFPLLLETFSEVEWNDLVEASSIKLQSTCGIEPKLGVKLQPQHH